MINNVVLTGRLTKDPELRKVNDVSVCSFILAVDRSYKNAKGEREADFIPIVSWRKLAEICSDNLVKGSLIGVIGNIRTSNWEDDEGNKRKSVEVVADNITFLEIKQKSQLPTTLKGSGL